MIDLNPQKSLPLYDESIDTFGREPFYAAASSVFLRTKDGKFILMRQTKGHRVVGDNYVGIGGKAVLESHLGTTEKMRLGSLSTAIMMGKFDVQEDIKHVAVREVFEETGGYLDDDNTIPSGYGINLNPEKLQSIGSSTVKLANEQSHSTWEISYFVYDLDDTEGTIAPSESKEGVFELYDENDILNLPMLPADKVILHNTLGKKIPNLRVEAIYDDLSDSHIMRSIFTEGLKTTYILMPDYRKPGEYIGRMVEYGGDDSDDNLSKLFNLVEDDGLKTELIQHFFKGNTWHDFSFPEGKELLSLGNEQKKI